MQNQKDAVIYRPRTDVMKKIERFHLIRVELPNKVFLATSLAFTLYCSQQETEDNPKDVVDMQNKFFAKIIRHSESLTPEKNLTHDDNFAIHRIDYSENRSVTCYLTWACLEMDAITNDILQDCMWYADSLLVSLRADWQKKDEGWQLDGCGKTGAWNMICARLMANFERSREEELDAKEKSTIIKATGTGSLMRQFNDCSGSTLEKFAKIAGVDFPSDETPPVL